MAGGSRRALRRAPSRLVVDALGQHAAQEIGIDERAEIEGLAELALLLQLHLGQPEQADGEVVRTLSKPSFGLSCLTIRRSKALGEFGAVLGAALPSLFMSFRAPHD